MRKPIHIEYLRHTRDCVKLTLRTLNNLPVEYRRAIKFNLWTHEADVERYRKFLDAYLRASIEREVYGVPWGFNYIRKVREACRQDCDYCIKWDEDIFIPSQTLMYMIDRCRELDNEKNLLMAPALSIGLPTVEMWAEDHLTDAERAELYGIFLKTHIRDRWGMDFAGLNKYTELADKWDGPGFYGAVDKIPNGFYRGIHPVRVSCDAQWWMARWLVDHAEKFNADHCLRLEPNDTYPYFCNSHFMIRRDLWQKIANDEELFKDAFDEVPINAYRKLHNLRWLFVRGAFGVHMTYRTVDDKRINDLEPWFYPEFERRVSGLSFDLAWGKHDTDCTPR